MGKIAFVFSGQGAQYPGMGRELCQESGAAKAVFELADQIRPGTSAQCFEGTKEELQRTINTQPCVYCVDLAAAEALAEAGIKPDVVAGFSLGEVAALTYAGWFTREDGFRFVCRRAELMEEAAGKVEATMAAVLKLKNEQVEAICSEHEGVYPVNYNCPGQLTVAGSKEIMPQFAEAVAAAGGKARMLAVGGAFHSPYMNSASDGLAAELAEKPLQDGKLPVYANRTALPYIAGEAEALLAAQVNSPVRWQETVEHMIDDGVDTFVEVGPGKTLAGLVKKISAQVTVCGVEDGESLKKAVAVIRGEA